VHHLAIVIMSKNGSCVHLDDTSRPLAADGGDCVLMRRVGLKILNEQMWVEWGARTTSLKKK